MAFMDTIVIAEDLPETRICRKDHNINKEIAKTAWRQAHLGYICAIWVQP